MSTDAMYNAESRYLHKMYRIHFSAAKVLDVVKSDYLISSSVLEEACKVSSSPFGAVTSNELELSLLNSDGMFNPKNTEGPYYGYIRRGIKIEAFIRPDEETEWDKLGVFYVTDWNTSPNGMTAEVVANDALYSVLNAPVPSTKIVRDVAFADFVTWYFALFGVTVTVDKSIDLVLPYGFTSGYTDNREFLADLMTAAIADCFCTHDGSVVILSKIAPRSTRATLTDSDQIVSVAIKHTIATDYDSAAVSYNFMQESSEREVLSIKASTVSSGVTSTELTKFSVPRVLGVKSIRVDSVAAVKPVGFAATSDDIVCSLHSNSETEAQVVVLGTALEAVSSVVSTKGTSSIEINSDFIQTLDNANKLLNYADKYVTAELPSLDLVIRGNPRLQIGDRIEVYSTRYRVHYVGILTKAKYSYAGGLSCEISLTADMSSEV